MHARGFTIVELLVGITLLAVLLGLGVPAMGTYLQNSKLASATASYLAGLQTARAEAIRRNTRAELALTDDPITIADLANALGASPTGRNWVVRAASGAGYAPAIEAKSGKEGEGSAAAAAIVVSASASAISFNGFGATADNAAHFIAISNPAAGACVVDGGPIRCRRINVSPGGQIHACDPTLAAGDSRAC
jgi:type IV fimbrial biogenesis protein FimT